MLSNITLILHHTKCFFLNLKVVTEVISAHAGSFSFFNTGAQNEESQLPMSLSLSHQNKEIVRKRK